MSVPKLLLLSFLQNAVLSAIAVGAGLLAAHSIGLGAPYIEAVLSNGQSQVFADRDRCSPFELSPWLLVGDLLFLPYWPKALLETAKKTTLWENFTASFYGGINEEILIRLFGFSVLHGFCR